MNRQQAVVLQVRAYGDHDAVVPMFTSDSGRVTCFFRGLRKPKKRNQLSLRPGFVLSLELEKRPGSDLLSASTIDVLDTHLKLANDLPRLLALNLVLEAVRDGYADGQSDPEGFALLVATLRALGTHPVDAVVPHFCQSLLQLLGYETAHHSAPLLLQDMEGALSRTLPAFRFFCDTVASNEVR